LSPVRKAQKKPRPEKLVSRVEQVTKPTRIRQRRREKKINIAPMIVLIGVMLAAFYFIITGATSQSQIAFGDYTVTSSSVGVILLALAIGAFVIRPQYFAFELKSYSSTRTKRRSRRW
jgi:hypothetical protein